MKLASAIETLKNESETRTFGVADPSRRECVRDGYMLALEEVAAAMGARWEYGESPEVHHHAR